MTGSHSLRWGILGAGGIAATVGPQIAASPASQVVAVGARSVERAAALAAALGAPRSYGSYSELVADPDIDVIYVATTHAQHRAHALLALDAGKHVLVEKAFTLNAREAREIVSLARERRLFCMEGMWMRFNPLLRQAVSIARSGRIGGVVSVRAELSAHFPFDPKHRLFDLSAGGGALLDLGVYVSHFAWMFAGRPDSVQVIGSLSPTGSDETAAMQWGYADGRFAQLACTTRSRNPSAGFILGTDGWIDVVNRLHRPTKIIVSSGGDEETIDAPGPATFAPEIAEVERCLAAGEHESPVMPLDDTVQIMELLDYARAELGVHYPADSRLDRPSDQEG